VNPAAAPSIPSGTVTLLFTDVEGSTRLWEAEPDLMARALRRHDELLRAAIGQARGFVFKTVGDAFCAAFTTPRAALDAVLAAQRALTSERWPTHRPIRVRMGLHTGVCEERDSDYFGPVVNRTARLEAVAHGGQVLVSGATAELLTGALPGGVTLRDLGLHRLKDLGRPEQVFQVEAEFLEPGFPPLGTLDNPELPNNLPGLLSAFVGREREVDEVRALVGSSRLVTLTGAGGCGKTRLALQAAAELLDGSADGVWLAELAPVTDGGQIPAAVAAALGLPDHGGPPSPESVTEVLREQNTLILLDNCEHVIDAAAKFCALLVRGCPRVRVLATSREPLGIDGERVFRVPSLSLPPVEAETADEVAASDAGRLFADRARAQDPGFVLDESDAALVASICRRLDGIPLALELAAARLSSMSLTHLSQRLDHRFRLLTGGSRNAMPRQQTLQATVDWSFSLLTEAERMMLTRLSVFAGGFELEAAEATCAADPLDAFDAADLLGSLVDKSLVVADRTPQAVRYRLLETMRQYSAQELLRAGGEDEVLAARDRHAEFYLRLAETAAPELTGPGQGEWLRRLDQEWDNLRAAFTHLAGAGRGEDVLCLAVALHRFGLSRGHTEIYGQLRTQLGAILAGPAPAPSPLVGRAAVAAVEQVEFLLRKDRDELAEARRYAGLGLEMARALGDRSLEARALGVLGELAFFDGDNEAVARLCGQAVAIARQTGDRHLVGRVLQGLIIIAPSAEESRRIRLEALACFRQTGDALFAASELHQIYGLDLAAGCLADARAHMDEAIALAEGLGDRIFRYFIRSDLAILLLLEGRPGEAAPVIRRCLLTWRRTGARLDVAELLFGAACCTAWQGHHATAARLHGAADADIERAIADKNVSWTATEQQLREREQGRLRQLMGDEAFDAGYRAGAGLTRVQGIELALSHPAAG